MAYVYKITLPMGWHAHDKKPTDADRQIVTTVAATVQYMPNGALLFYDPAGFLIKAYAPGMWKTLDRQVVAEDDEWTMAAWLEYMKKEQSLQKGGEPNG